MAPLTNKHSVALGTITMIDNPGGDVFFYRFPILSKFNSNTRENTTYFLAHHTLSKIWNRETVSSPLQNLYDRLSKKSDPYRERASNLLGVSFVTPLAIHISSRQTLKNRLPRPSDFPKEMTVSYIKVKSPKVDGTRNTKLLIPRKKEETKNDIIGRGACVAKTFLEMGINPHSESKKDEEMRVGFQSKCNEYLKRLEADYKMKFKIKKEETKTKDDDDKKRRWSLGSCVPY